MLRPLADRRIREDSTATLRRMLTAKGCGRAWRKIAWAELWWRREHRAIGWRRSEWPIR